MNKSEKYALFVVVLFKYQMAASENRRYKQRLLSTGERQNEQTIVVKGESNIMQTPCKSSATPS
jgi:hypothetical protein